jgi:DNA-binding transcriptional LysR family regulator
MNRLRALEYFVAAAEVRSFSRAARSLEVSVPAVARLIGALEAQLGVKLLGRSNRGLTLTADGARYLDACRPLLQQLAAAEEAVTGPSQRPHGTLVVGAPAYLSQHCLLPALPEFHNRHPEIQIDIRNVDRVTAPEADLAEVLVLYGWPDSRNWVQRRVAQTRMLVCASPDYWKAHGMPRHPRDLQAHNCLLFRDQEGTVLDLWSYERGETRATTTVRGWFVSSHRDDLLQAAMDGLGVARFSDLSVQFALRQGLLVPALMDWDSRDAPPVNLLYRANHRRLPRVQLFADFITRVFARLEKELRPVTPAAISAERPAWYRRRRTRASAATGSGARRRG